MRASCFEGPTPDGGHRRGWALRDEPANLVHPTSIHAPAPLRMGRGTHPRNEQPRPGAEMPLRGYSTDNRPPTVLDHLLAHPYTIAICSWQVLAGVLSLLVTLFDFTVSQSVQRLPEPIIAALGALLIVGGVQTIRGLLDDRDDLMKGWMIERTGLIFSTAAWLGYLVTIVAAYPSGVLTWTLCVLMATANILRFVATRREERRHRANIRKAGVG